MFPFDDVIMDYQILEQLHISIHEIWRFQTVRQSDVFDVQSCVMTYYVFGVLGPYQHKYKKVLPVYCRIDNFVICAR